MLTMPPLSAMELRVKEILAQVATDPEVIEALANNPKIKAAYDDVCANPSGFMAYVNDPDVATQHMLREFIEHSVSNQPVAEWPL